MTHDCNPWLGNLANLKAARTAARGTAPHKPLMLLTVIDLIESGDVPDGWVHYDVRLVSRFRDYWELVQERQRNSADIPMPFHALGGDGVWQRFTREGQPSLAKATTRLCHLDPELFGGLQDPDFRRKVRETLIAIYFTAREQIMLSARLGLPAPKSTAVEALRADASDFRASQKKGRDSRFKSDVLGGYYFTCALTGYRLDTETSSIVQAAHIHQHAASGNNDPRNGLALTPDAHWMFDAGLWTAVPAKSGYFVIQVAKGRFNELSPHGRLLGNFDGQCLRFHDGARLRPDPKHFEWHRSHFAFDS
jgi:putative restriction endonuclease